MKKIIALVFNPLPSQRVFNGGMLFFRAAASLELITVHGLKKLGVGAKEAEIVPNPLHLSEVFNHDFATTANLILPVFILIGFCTRLAALPVLAVTLTGYFVLHWSDPPLIKDTPYMYSLVYLLILAFGPGKYSIDYSISKKLSS